VLVSDVDPALLLHAMRAGIRDILSPQADAAEIRVLLERACQSFATRHRGPETQSENGGKGLVIGVFSPKGGVGKTTLATNIAIGLGQIAPMSVVIVDLDLQFGDVASGLYLNPEHTVTDAVTPAASPGLPGPQGVPHRAPGRHLRPLRSAQPGGRGPHHPGAGQPAGGATVP
jgi:pilus assembly protein CpaE